MMTFIYISQSCGLYNWNTKVALYFISQTLIHLLIAALLAWILWRFLFAKKHGLLLFAGVYFISMFTACICQAKELCISGASLTELTIMFQTPSDETLELLRTKSYGVNTFSDWAPILECIRKEVLFTHDMKNEWKRALEDADIDNALTINALCNHSSLIQTRKSLETLYNKLIALQRKCLNYYENLFLTAKNHPFKLKENMLRHLQMCHKNCEDHYFFCQDYYTNQRNLIFVLDDLCLYLLNLNGNYDAKDGRIRFTNDVERAKYEFFLSEIDYLYDAESKIFTELSDRQKQITL